MAEQRRSLIAIWIGNIPPDASDDDLKALLEKYALPTFAASERVPGDGSRPGVVLEFADRNAGELFRVVQRLEGLYWKGRELSCALLPVPPEPAARPATAKKDQ